MAQYPLHLGNQEFNDTIDGFKVFSSQTGLSDFTYISFSAASGPLLDIQAVHTVSTPNRYLIRHPCAITAYHIEKFRAFQDMELHISLFKTIASPVIRDLECCISERPESASAVQSILGPYRQIAAVCESFEVVCPSIWLTHRIFQLTFLLIVLSRSSY